MSVCSDCGVIVSITPIKVERQGSSVGAHYDITVRLDNGVETTVSQDLEPKLAVGSAVRIVDRAVIGK